MRVFPMFKQRFAPVAIALIVMLGAVPGDAQTNDEIDDIREQRRIAQEAEAEAASTVDTTTAELDEITTALEVLNGNVVTKEVELNNARAQLADAEAELESAETAVEEKEDEIAGLRDQVSDRAILSFVNQDDRGSVFIETADPNQAARMQVLVEEVTQTDVDVVEQLRGAEEDLLVERARADTARAEALRLEGEIAGQLTELETARDLQSELAIEAEGRLNAQLAELESLRAIDARLAAEEQAAVDELARQLARRDNTGGGSLSGSTQSIPIPPNHEIIKVSGFWVHQSIATNVEAMMAAAAADGIVFGGGGWRDSQRQIELRRKHCGTSDYAVYEMPSSQCRPPTATPGASMHERGLALDLTYQSLLIGTRNNDGYRWLEANAAAYGFFNLPSEPWHWSTNGR